MSSSWDAVGQPAADLETPALLLDLDVMEGNIARMARVFREAGVQWRPHTKGIKVPAIAHKLLAAGAVGVTCAKVSEAEVMAAAGIRDVLIANQVVGPQKALRLAALCREADPIATVDSSENVQELDGAAGRLRVRLRVVVEVNCGLDRCGVAPGEPVVKLAQEVANCPNLVFAGLMTWEGHTLALPLQDRAAAVAASLRLLTDSAQACRAAGLPVDIVNCGGTGDYWIAARVPGVTEIEAGGGVFGDRYCQAKGVDHPIGLSVLATVVSRPTPTRVVTDAGRKAMSVESHGEPWPRGAAGVTGVRVSAEHGQYELAAASASPRIGEKQEWLVAYGDLTVFLHETLYGVRNGIVEAAWPILGRGKIQ
jgi:D-serine deaminase-like pyridoxal phosphate-dependent protein